MQGIHSKARKILVVCMFDSIHSARWLAQFLGDPDLEIFIFPSRRFKHLNHKLRLLLAENQNIRLAGFSKAIPKKLLGYYSYLRFEIIGKLRRQPEMRLRGRALKSVYKSIKPNVIHALEIQGAGYLVSSILKESMRPERAIVTNWGSDLFFYGQIPSERVKIIECLNNFTHYSAECQRDYELALKYEFKGIMLPCMPNGGGIEMSNITAPSPLSSTRKLMLVKAYGGTFGLGNISVSLTERVLEILPAPKVFFYSVTDDLELKIQELAAKFPGRVEYSTVRKGLSHEALIEKFKVARCYLGMSRSDGISTSFLEALTYGSYPIQTDTSCAAEWIDLGAVGFVVQPQEVSQIVNKVCEVFLDDNLVDQAQLVNNNLAKQFLSFDYLKTVSQVFYK